jgi:hypothetical protein
MTESTFAPHVVAPTEAPLPSRHDAALDRASAGTHASVRHLARVSLLDTLILALHQHPMALDDAAPASQTALTATLNPLVADLTQQLLREGVVSPGELAVMHQRARRAALAAFGAADVKSDSQGSAGSTRPVPIRAVAWAKPA